MRLPATGRGRNRVRDGFFFFISNGISERHIYTYRLRSCENVLCYRIVELTKRKTNKLQLLIVGYGDSLILAQIDVCKYFFCLK